MRGVPSQLMQSTPSKRTGAGVIVIALAALALLAPSPAAATTRSEYVQQADPVCGHAGYAMGLALRGFPRDMKKGEYRRAAAKLRRAFAIFKTMIADLAVIPPPQADATLIARWLDSLRGQTQIGDGLARAIARKQFKQMVKKANQLSAAERQSDQLVSGFGFQYCVSS